MIGDFPIQFLIYTNCPLHHLFLAWEAYGQHDDFIFVSKFYIDIYFDVGGLLTQGSIDLKDFKF